MKSLFLLFIIIVAIEWNLQWNGLEHIPNQVKAWDNNGQEIELVSEWQKSDGVYYWSAKTYDRQYNWFLNFWEE